MKNRGHNDYAKIFPNYLQLTPLSQIKSTHFIIDKLLIGIGYQNNQNSNSFLRSIGKVYKKSKPTKEIFTNSKSFNDLFLDRTYLDLGLHASGMVLTEKAKAISNIDALISIHDATPKVLSEMEACLNQIKGINHWLTYIEFTFDFLMKDNSFRRPLQQLLKRSLHFKWGRVGFEVGPKEDATFYINSRISSKQIKTYLKPFVEINGKLRKTMRFEIGINRQKAKNIGLLSISDLLKYDLGIFDELRFYQIDPLKISRSLHDMLCSHYFAKLAYKNIKGKRGLQGTVQWAGKNVEGCPSKCHQFDLDGCVMGSSFRKTESRRRVFKIIGDCPHSRKVNKFLERYAVALSNFYPLKRRMRKSFRAWINRG